MRKERAFWFEAATTVVAMMFGPDWSAYLVDPVWYALLFGWLFGAMLWLSFAVVRHADALAVKLGEP
ncbi:MAG: hypothetical protein ACYTHK_04050 [Planctomycetota bacterium]|jgi:Ca2+:H+ antiporter